MYKWSCRTTPVKSRNWAERFEDLCDAWRSSLSVECHRCLLNIIVDTPGRSQYHKTWRRQDSMLSNSTRRTQCWGNSTSEMLMNYVLPCSRFREWNFCQTVEQHQYILVRVRLCYPVDRVSIQLMVAIMIHQDLESFPWDRYKRWDILYEIRSREKSRRQKSWEMRRDITKNPTIFLSDAFYGIPPWLASTSLELRRDRGTKG